ncbi:MAG: molecular chaperone DnaK [Actinomycetia bacterium]|nr:molecular chaperone DnaK [Actinomycetes bacterium]
MTDNDPRERLLAERARVQSLIEGVREELGEASVEEFGEASQDVHRGEEDPIEDGSVVFEREKDLAILESLEHDLEEIEAALTRVDDGTYGIDEVTGEPINPERLAVLPTARTNVESA